ncbi:hypothetical protein B7994_10860 [Fibrobacter sp. UWR2]|nr:hypothetical protein B7994_10860 [Fibrobacter sp. UWR2]
MHKHHTPHKLFAGILGRFRYILGTVFACMLFAGCLDIPDKPNTESQLESIDVVVLQAGKEDSTLLKIRPNDSSEVRVVVYPRQYRKQLSFQWSRVIGDSSYVLGEGSEYTIAPNTDRDKIPNELQVMDEAGNSLKKDFEIFVNMEPILSSTTIPANEDTLYGNTHTAFLFKWKSYDNDSFDDGKLEHTLIIDGVYHPVGRLTEIRQSGFNEGQHSFQVIVFDTFGDSDTLAPMTFYVVDTLGGMQ